MRLHAALAFAGLLAATPALAGENAKCVGGTWKPVATDPELRVAEMNRSIEVQR